MTSDVDAYLDPDAPTWFRRALHTPFFDESVDVDGARIHYLAWGEPGRRGIVFVHGGAAHAHWWTHVAATFSTDYRVVALDMSGHGDSDHRATYSLEQWSAEVMAVAADAGIEGPPVLVGHSMGGFVAIATAALHSDQLAGVIVLDSPVAAVDGEVGAAQARQAFGVKRVYATVDEALARFRTVPPQEHYLPYVMHHVARRSLQEVEGGYSWKFDHDLFSAFTAPVRQVALPYLSQVRCRFALLRAEHGLVTPDIGESMYEQLGRAAPVVELPEMGHHGMLDQPLIVITAVRALLADWDHSTPRQAR
ncbi:MAG: alpha/beta hydrolase [Acidimicrobiales bacterium]